MFDVNMAMEEGSAEADYVSRTIQQDEMFASLMRNDAFSGALYGRLVSLAKQTFGMDRVNALIDRHEALLEGQMALKNLRFYNGERSPDYFIQNCEAIRRFYERRAAYMIGQYGY